MDLERAWPLGSNYAGRPSWDKHPNSSPASCRVNADGEPPTPDKLTLHGTWDGNNCPDCYEDDGGESDRIPCTNCGWFKCPSTHQRYPPGFTAVTWGTATLRIRAIRAEFPTLWRERVSLNVQCAGESDTYGVAARNALTGYQLAERFEEKYAPALEYDDIAYVVPNLQPSASNPEPRYNLEEAADRILGTFAKKMTRKTAWRTEHERQYDSGFNEPFDESMVEILQTINGCSECKAPNARKTCSACHFTVYCNRDCQIKSWKGGHKTECKTISESMNKGPKPLSLYYFELLSPDVLNSMMVKRTTRFFEEVCRCNSATMEILDFNISVVNNMGRACLQGWATFRDDNIKVHVVPYALFRSLASIDENNLREMIYEGCGDIPESLKEDVILLLKDFFTQAIEHEISIKIMSLSRATLWLCDERYKEKLRAPEVEERCCGMFYPPYGPKVIRPSDSYADCVTCSGSLWELSNRQDLPR